MKKNLLFLIIFGCACTLSCTSQIKTGNFSFLPEVNQPTYKAYNIRNERGYEVKFKLAKDMPQPTAIIFNHIKKTILSTEHNNENYHVNVIAQTTLISDYIIEKSDLSNGLLYEIDGKSYHQKVDFVKAE